MRAPPTHAARPWLLLGTTLALACEIGPERWKGDRQVEVPQSTFWMGCDPAGDATCPADAQPAHQLRISAFLIDRLEVQVGDFEACVDDGVCTPRRSAGGLPEDPTLPVTWVEQAQAKRFCTWAGKRLPTEAEWELAARGTDGRSYPWGEEEPDCDLVAMPSCGARVEPAGAHPDGASPWGALDMAGNVGEIVSDGYAPDWYGESPSEDPEGPAGTGLRLVRGLALWTGGDSLRITRRFPAVEAASSPVVGFRCVEEL